jgi:hypothetical protein
MHSTIPCTLYFNVHVPYLIQNDIPPPAAGHLDDVHEALGESVVNLVPGQLNISQVSQGGFTQYMFADPDPYYSGKLDPH